MPRESQGEEVSQILDWVEAAHGHRIALTQQQVREGNYSRAALHRGEAMAFHKMILVMEDVLDTGELADWELPNGYYPEISRAMIEANRLQNGKPEPNLKGLE